MKRILLAPMAVLALVILASANSSAYGPPVGLDYYWVPGNLLLFHIPFPLDFLFYFFAIVGFTVVVRMVVLGVIRFYVWLGE
jgi:hypothetical protein